MAMSMIISRSGYTFDWPLINQKYLFIGVVLVFSDNRYAFGNNRIVHVGSFYSLSILITSTEQTVFALS